MSESRIKELVTDVEKLREICETVNIKASNEEVREIVLALKETMRANGLVALSAPQIGIPYRIFCLKDNKGLHSFINPMIQKSTEMTFSREKDECFPDKEYIYPRSGKLVVNYQTPLGEIKGSTVVGYSAFVVQRMIDHLNGVLISDIGLEIDNLWDEATDEERVEVLKAYADALDLVGKKVNEEIEQDEDLKKQLKAIEFQHALVAGDVSVEKEQVTEEQKEQLETKFKELSELEEKDTLNSNNLEEGN